ncbi:hypothetical protein [Pseudomonas sp. B33.4]|uniref:hypothetical protein n=1 Tax=Pseudomonas sp. B33.4 TaxID=3104265 RepID=UPI002ADEDB2E|nr:hypothetical protein [Pseudomonas sp. B33.4]
MPIKIDFSNNTITDCGIGVSAPSDMDLEFIGSSNKFRNVKKVFDFQDRSLFSKLGLSPDTDPEVLKVVIERIKAIAGESIEKKTELVSQSSLMKWVGFGATASTLTKNLLDFIERLSQ